MHLLPHLLTALLTTTALASRDPRHVRKDHKAPITRRSPPTISERDESQTPPCYGGPCSNSTIIPQTAATAKFAVNGSAIPDVDWDIGESYAGLLPVSNVTNSSELYFWFFPSENALAGNEIVIWLNGGPGCSSLEGILQENGPFLWQYGTYKPVKNP
jgi:carboxypeptidase D